VIVEGKYDKIKLSSIIDAVIIETGGFSIFKNREQLELIRKLAVAKGVIIMTDSDRAGFMIRNFLSGALPKDRVRHVYIPDVKGQERRKSEPSKEGKLGVEGISKELITKSLERAGIPFNETVRPVRRITKLDLYEDGFAGGFKSLEKRRRLLTRLGLPLRLSSNMLVDVLNAMMSYDEYRQAADGL
jgi:ribonuclease M5